MMDVDSEPAKSVADGGTYDTFSSPHSGMQSEITDGSIRKTDSNRESEFAEESIAQNMDMCAQER